MPCAACRFSRTSILRRSKPSKTPLNPRQPSICSTSALRRFIYFPYTTLAVASRRDGGAHLCHRIHNKFQPTPASSLEQHDCRSSFCCRHRCKHSQFRPTNGNCCHLCCRISSRSYRPTSGAQLNMALAPPCTTRLLDLATLLQFTYGSSRSTPSRPHAFPGNC